MIRRRCLLPAAAWLALARTVHAQAWPSRPIRLVIPYPAGGSTDILGRAVALRMGDALGQPMVVDNKPGASGNIGADLVAKATPDGYTMVVGNNATHATKVTASLNGIRMSWNIGGNTGLSNPSRVLANVNAHY